MQQQTRASSKPGSQPGQTNKFGGTNKAGLTGTIGAVKALHPEDDWELTANPSNYLDQLPQPFKFINTCLDFEHFQNLKEFQAIYLLMCDNLANILKQ